MDRRKNGYSIITQSPRRNPGYFFLIVLDKSTAFSYFPAMGFHATKIALYKKQLATKQAQIAKLNAALEKMIDTGAKSYKFDSGEGSQLTTWRSFDEITDMLQLLEATEDHLINKLHGMGLVSIQLRRRP